MTAPHLLPIKIHQYHEVRRVQQHVKRRVPDLAGVIHKNFHRRIVIKFPITQETFTDVTNVQVQFLHDLPHQVFRL